MSVHRFLVTTARAEARFDMWEATAGYANWLEGRVAGKGGTRETWLVTVFDVHALNFLTAARRLDTVTVEEIHGAGDDERYVLRVGEPGTGWVKP